MVYVYAADVRNLPDPKEFPEIMEGLSKERKQKILRLVQEQDRKQSLGAGLLLQTVLLRYGVSVEDIRYGENGKPELCGICFNLSHSHNMVACAVSDKPVGCDIEKIRDMKEQVAKRFFCEGEIAHIKASLDADAELIRLWTIKESYMKMTGEGLKLGLDKVQVSFEDGIRVFLGGEQCSCYVKEYEIPGYKLSVCAEEAEFTKEVEYIEI